ncbi:MULTISPECIES: 50S ribosomal protein L18 [Flammeovirga]|uniref:Large ribosomal subunit protein uL18 n=2 Tax=Flammeovirga TaxID=59739 RepID=A0A3S9NXI7_9BACT|nr:MULTISPECIES: 50S ribosomal protein L18 [Flammeovirga]AZQ60671.1 50S ribosomal protein L18 [Flammeovirga pectinis]MBB6462067.1 large subunit ribosomal protein L18 [Flammeovirga kamogawensis]QWG05803.1 50S ribosomal protein L18 [Flammeovirga kamogawensis]TRX67630.1 50S ribosomal protein L18 [Flammeovirga kamogawensis]
MATKKDLRRLRIKRGIRKKVSGTPERPRLSVYKSNTAIYVQLIDDLNGRTVAAISSREINAESKSTNIALASEVGKKVAEKATAAGISTVVFDRNGYLYHGKVKALAEGAREGGLKF